MKVKNILNLFVVLFFAQNNFAQTNFQWVVKSQGTFLTEGYAVKADQVGNVYAVGRFDVGGDFDPGPGVSTLTCAGNSDAYLVKFDPNGNFIWGISIGGISTDVALDVETDASNNAYVTGYFNGTVDFDPGPGSYTLVAQNADAFVCKLNSTGNFVWARSFGGPSWDYGSSLNVDGTGNVFATGTYSGTVDFDPGPGTFTVSGGRVYALKLDASGNFVWAKNLNNGATGVEGHSIKTDTSGNVFIKGLFSGTADFDPNAGSFTLTSSGVDDMFITKLDGLGNFVWTKTLGGTNTWLNYCGKTLSIDATGNVYVIGTFNGTEDFDPGPGTFTMTAGSADAFICKLDASGNLAWAFQLTVGGGIDDGGALVLDANANIFVTGTFGGMIDFDPGPGTATLSSAFMGDVYIAKYNSAGNYLWAGRVSGVGGTFNDRGFGLSIDPSGNLFATGSFVGNCDFDPGPGTYTMNCTGSNSNYILKLGNAIIGMSEHYLNSEMTCFYPNPSQGKFAFSVPKNADKTKNTLFIYDVFGKLVESPQLSELNLLSENNFEIDLSGRLPGVYLYRYFSDDKLISSGKIIKE